MTEFRDKVAVITGAASGIGRALAKQCAQEGMQVVLADIDQEKLRETQEALKTLGADVLAVPTDVSKVDDVERLLQATLEQFHAVHLLCNNAGIFSAEDAMLPLWQVPQAEWQRMVDINLWGVIHGIRIFTPVMLQQDTTCYMVNTASMAGIGVGELFGIYGMTKHAVVSLSETMHQQLNARQAKLHVAVLCPGFTSTSIINSEASRYQQVVEVSEANAMGQEEKQKLQWVLQGVRDGVHPAQVAQTVFQALRQKAVYIFTDSGALDFARDRFENIVQRSTSPAQSTQ